MIYVVHRVNKTKQLKKIAHNYGVEVDIRSNSSKLIIHHDPFKKGELFENWLENYNHKFLIINVKEEGLEPFILEKLNKFKIKKFFFLDQSFPFILKYSKELSYRSAVRFSEFENIQTPLAISKYVNWIWIDCFFNTPLNKSVIKKLCEYSFKTCLVSPELHGRDPNLDIPWMIKKLNFLKFRPNAICTKYPEIWENHFGY